MSFGSMLLVAVQVGCVLAMLARVRWWPWSPGALALCAAGFLLGVRALAAMRLGQLRVHPEVMPGAELRTKGPYALVRHPMYGALLLGCLGLLLQRPDAPMALLWLALAADLALKMRREERFLLAHFPEYAEYMRRTRRVLPWIL